MTAPPILLRVGAACLFFFIPLFAASQLTTNAAATAGNAVTSLVGPGVDVSNIAFVGAADQVGTFTCVGCGLGFDEGMILSTGSVDVAMGPNNSGSATLGGGNWGASDPDLALANPGFGLNDAASLEFDFVAQGDSVYFEYVWASEEYPEFVFSSFNDAFGFFLSGPGINGPFSNNAVNIALVPGTAIPVTIDNVNISTNSQYYVTNPSLANSIQFDGYTVVLTAEYGGLECGETYHIKMAIADAGDTGYDSAVFFDQNSFTTPQLDIDLSILDLGANDSTIFEGCGTSFLVFSRSGSLDVPQSFNIDISGTAIPDLDYDAFPSSIDFGIGEETIEIPFTGLTDNVVEGLESVTITFTAPGCFTTEEITETFYIIDPSPIIADVPDAELDCGESIWLVPIIVGGYGLYSVEWSTGETTDSILVAPNEATSYLYTVSDTCDTQPFTGEVDISLVEYPPIIIDLGNPYLISCLDNLDITAIAQGGNGAYQYSWSLDDGTVLSETEQLIYSPSSGDQITVEVIDGCGNSGSNTVDFSFEPFPISVDLPADFDGTCLSLIELTPTSVEGGIGVYSYQWLIDGLESSTDDFVSITVSGTSEIELIVTDECGNEGSDLITIGTLPEDIIFDLGDDLELTCIEAIGLEPQVSGGIGVYSYEWLSNDVFVGDAPSLTIESPEASEITLIVSDECGNTSTSSINLSIPPVPISFNLPYPLEIECLQDNEIFPTDLTGGVGTFMYTWFIDGIEVGNSQSLIVNTNQTSEITLQIEDECGNLNTESTLLELIPVPLNVSIGEDLIVNCLDVSELSAEVEGGVGQISYAWTFNDVQLGNTYSTEVQTDDDATITLSITDECGNTASDELFIEVPPVPINVSLGPDTIIPCLDIIDLSPDVNGGVGNYEWIWSVNGSPNGSENSLTQVIEDLTIIEIEVQDECGNSVSSSIEVDVPDLPPLIAVTESQVICLGDVVTLELEIIEVIGEAQITWTPGPSGSTSFNVSPSEDMSYTVTVSDACNNAASETVSISVEQAIAHFDFDYIGNWGIETYNSSLPENASYSWYFSDGFYSDEFEPHHEFENYDTNEIVLYVTSEHGCVDSIGRDFYPPMDIYVPNSFTPNNDGINDVFLVYGHDVRSFHLKIFNRWGEEVFSTTNMGEPWLGNMKSGEYYVQNEVYTYQLKAIGIRGNSIEKTGTITLIR